MPPDFDFTKAQIDKDVADLTPEDAAAVGQSAEAVPVIEAPAQVKATHDLTAPSTLDLTQTAEYREHMEVIRRDERIRLAAISSADIRHLLSVIDDLTEKLAQPKKKK